MSWMKAALETRSVELGYGGEINDDVIEAMSTADMVRIADQLHGRPPGESSRIAKAAVEALEEKANAHVHSRECYDDAGPGRGGVSLICGEPSQPDTFFPTDFTDEDMEEYERWQADYARQRFDEWVEATSAGDVPCGDQVPEGPADYDDIPFPS